MTRGAAIDDEDGLALANRCTCTDRSTCASCEDAAVRTYLRAVSARRRAERMEGELEEEFVRCAQGVAHRRRISREAWLAFGIELEILDRARVGAEVSANA